jgi:hypothetical protein
MAPSCQGCEHLSRDDIEKEKGAPKNWIVKAMHLSGGVNDAYKAARIGRQTGPV